MNILLAHTGKALKLECTPATKVSVLQQSLAELTGIPESDQIFLCNGIPVAPNKSLSVYGLGGSDTNATGGLFLYSKPLLQQTHSLPAEELPVVTIPSNSEQSPGIQGTHPLDNASSPLLRILPQYQRQFQEQLQQAQQLANESQQRVDTCIQLVGEMEVQALAVDAAMTSVEPHYAQACRSHMEFMAEFNKRRPIHEDILSRFDADLAFLTSIELPLQLQLSPNKTMLSHIVDVDALKELWSRCSRAHRHFAARVAELETLHTALCSEVEAVFMCAPVVDLDELSRGLDHMQSLLEEQTSMIQSLQADLSKVDALITDALAASPSGPLPNLGDAVAMLEAMHEGHTSTVLPRMQDCRTEVEEFAANCIRSKNTLTGDALRQLRTVSSQQTKIRDLRQRLAPFPQALSRQDGELLSLLVVRRLPAAYKQCLAECSRRLAFSERYGALASDLAEKMGRFRHKESSFRDGFCRHVEGLIPIDLLEAMGLLQQPPHCQVSVPGDETARLLIVNPSDLRRMQLPWSSSQLEAATEAISKGRAQQGPSSSSGAEGAVATVNGSEDFGEGGSGGADAVDVTASLRMENARLRAELASQVALDCIRAAEMAALGPLPAQLASSSSTAATTQAQETSNSTPDAVPSVNTNALGPDAARKFERALTAKDVLIDGITQDLKTSKQQCSAYEQRIKELESMLLQRSTPTSPRDSSITQENTLTIMTAATTSMLHETLAEVASTTASHETASGGNNSIALHSESGDVISQITRSNMTIDVHQAGDDCKGIAAATTTATSSVVSAQTASVHDHPANQTIGGPGLEGSQVLGDSDGQQSSLTKSLLDGHEEVQDKEVK